MPVEHSPAEGATDGRVALSKCNNHERKWAAQTAQRTQVLAMQVQGILHNDEASADDYAGLEKEIKMARRAASEEWETLRADLEQRGRDEALQQLARKWQVDERRMADAVLEVNQARHARFPKEKRQATAATPVEEEPEQAQEASCEGETVEPQLQAAAAPTAGSAGKATGARRKQQAGHTGVGVTDATPRGAEADALANFADLAAELQKMRKEMRQYETQTFQLNEDWQHKMNEALRKQENEFKKVLTEERQRHEMARRNWERRAPHRTTGEYYERPERASTPDRGRSKGWSKGPVGPRARLYSEGDAWQSFQDAPRRTHPGEQNDLPDQFQFPPPPLTRPPPSLPSQAPQLQTESPALQNPIISKYAANIPNYGKEEQKHVNAHSGGDENDEFYQKNFPFPFNEPPPSDARVVTEYRKLEGMAPKFSGKEEDFPTWSALFREVIHKVKCPMGFKALMLANCLNTADERLREIHDGAGATKADYARTITRLVRAYGHPMGEMAARREALEKVHRVRYGDFHGLEKWHMRLENLADAAKNLGREKELTDYRLYEENVRKMDYSLAQEYYNWCKMNKTHNDTITLLAWLGEAVDTARRIRRAGARQQEEVQHHAAITLPGRQQPHSNAGEGAAVRHGPRRNFRPCPMDGENHGLAMCEGFKKLDPFARREKLKEWKRCYACLAPGHNIRECGRGVVCQHCQHKHHTLLHGTSRSQARAARTVRAHVTDVAEEDTADDWSEDSAPEEEDEMTDQVALKIEGNKKKVALQTVPVTLHNGRRKIDTNLLMDQGATGAFISKGLADRLGLVGHMIESTVTGFDGVKTTGPAVMTHVQLSAYGTKKRHWIQVQVSKDPAGSYTPYNWAKKRGGFPHIAHLPIQEPIPGVPVEIMIGMDTPHLVASLEPDIGAESAKQPVARKTRLGWVVAGPTGENGNKDQRSTVAFFAKNRWVPAESNEWGTHQFRAHKATTTEPPDARDTIRTTRSRDEELQQLVTRMWEIDVAGGKPECSPTEEKIFQELREKLEMEDGRYVLPTLWKKGEPKISNNYSYALGRLRSLLKSPGFNKPEVQAQYQQQFKDWQEEGAIEEVQSDNPQQDAAVYLPHFPVVRMDKTSTQVRIVMDAAARATKGKSLNDCLNKGPKLVNELITVLMRFRVFNITIAADIKKMFHQIILKEEDRDYHRFLWQDEESGEVRVFRWRVHPFGSAASPCIAIFTIKEHARKWRHMYPQAAATVIHSTLVDDNLDSVNSPEEAIELGRQLIELFRKASMRLGKIASNSQKVLEAFPPEMVAKSLELADFCTRDTTLPLVKALGIIYLCTEDSFSFKMATPDKKKKWTKREVLRHEAKLYDPHGLISPHTSRARVILQKLWRRKVDWDEPMPKDIEKEWNTWLEDSEKLPQLRIPRGLNPDKDPQVKLHIFADASADAYAAAAYFVTRTSTRLMLSKVKVAPLHMTSIPRLELMAAVLALDLVEAIEAVLGKNQEIVYWTDSQNVLAWIHTDSRVLHTFVGTRIARIQQQTQATDWRWVDSENNPADLPSRGARLMVSNQQELWFSGPPFLKEPEEEWPKQPTFGQTTPDALKEVKKGASFALTMRREQVTDGYAPGKNEFPIQPDAVSNWSKLLRITARCLRMRPSGERGKGISAKELKHAEKTLFRAMQRASFQRTLSEMTTPPNTLTHNSSIKHLLPTLDKDGILRRMSRLAQLSHIPYDIRYQVILPKDHPWVPRLVQHVHEQLLHAGPQHTLAYLAKTAWIVKGSAVVRRVIGSCIICKKRKAKPTHPLMGQLPEFRFPSKRVDPFTFTALDAAGPFLLQEHKKDKPGKVYFLLLTCLVYRAVHLEPLNNMTANTFLNALQRFMARRGMPQKIISDNGSNFVAANSELQQLWTAECREQCQSRFPRVEWEFIPPYSPHFGGVYERLVQAVKNSLYHTFKPNHTITMDQFHTSLVVVEGILNSRPLTYRSTDNEVPEPLTPADFLAVGPYREMAIPPGTEVPLVTKWRNLQERLNYFWKRFQEEITPYLQKMTKWRKQGRNLQQGDIVVYLDGSRRGAWPLARVMTTEAGKDGVVRRVTILSKGTVYRRAAEKVMVLLPREEEEKLNERIRLGETKEKKKAAGSSCPEKQINNGE